MCLPQEKQVPVHLSMLQVMQDINKVSWQGQTVSVFATGYCKNQIHAREDSVPANMPTNTHCQWGLVPARGVARDDATATPGIITSRDNSIFKVSRSNTLPNTEPLNTPSISSRTPDWNNILVLLQGLLCLLHGKSRSWSLQQTSVVYSFTFEREKWLHLQKERIE